MTPSTERTMVTLTLAVFLAAALAMTFGLSPTAQRVPLAVILPTLALVLAELAAERLPRVREKYRRLEKIDLFGVDGERRRHHAPDLPAGDERGAHAMLRRRELDMARWIAVLLGLVWLGGFLVGLPLYTVLYLRVRSRERRGLAIALAVALAVALQAMAVGLRVRLYEGGLGVLADAIIGRA